VETTQRRRFWTHSDAVITGIPTDVARLDEELFELNLI
jgi:hypothetical protein